MTDFAEQALVEDGTLPPDDFHDSIDRIQEVAHYELEIPSDIVPRLEKRATNLLTDPALLREAVAALAVGHLVIQGPPGTGKSTLARLLCEAFGADYLLVTAHEEWSSFEVIGRHELRVDKNGNEEIVGVNGFFTEAAIQCAGAFVRHADNEEEAQATWLIIDELNRAQPDKAFGELFSVLGTNEPVPITLPHQPTGNNILVTPRRFRLIATLNSVDKQFVNALSQGLRRRFSFVTMDIPPKRKDGEEWGSESSDASIAAREFRVVVDAASERMANRLTSDGSESVAAKAAELRSLLVGDARPFIESIFNLAELVRYSGADSDLPFVPIGTASLIDTVELFLSMAWLDGLAPKAYGTAVDWAVSVKLVPLLDVGTANRAQLVRLADSLPSTLQTRTKQETLRVASDGLHYVA